MKQLFPLVGIASSITFGYLATLTPATAQIVPDNTLGVNSRVTPGCTVCTIDGGTIRGVNLFHSFSEFSVPTGGEAFFNNGLHIQNILTRVTGNSVSNINGLIRANGTANLFFVNPNGISFGANATLNLGGSFIASTASSLVFADGTVFSAKPDTSTPPLLTISVPLGLQYGTNPGKIVVQGNGQGTRTTSDLIDTDFGLRVQPNQTLALVGGDVSLEGATLKTAGGRIELGSVAGQGLVSLTPTSQGWTLGYQGVSTLGDIQMSQQATVDASGLGGGDIQVWGRRVTLTGGSNIEASTLGKQLGGTLAVNATESVELIGTSADGQFGSGLFSQVYPGASGKVGDLTINTGNLLVRDGAQVGAGTFGGGDGGKLTVNASQQVQVIGTSADGQFGSGLFSQVNPGASGKAGDLTINTGTLLVRDGAGVSAGTFGGGDGGKLTINASQQVQVIGTSADGRASSRLLAQATPGASGKAGDLTINTDTLLVRDGAQVSVRSFQGQAGNMTILANSVRLNRGRLFAETAKSDAPDGANITLSGLDLLQMDNESLISANALNAANGGKINIDTKFLIALPPVGANGSDIIANAFQGRGGTIQIQAAGIFGIEQRSSIDGNRTNDIDASSQFGAAGQVTLNTLINPTQGLTQLPTQLVDPSRQIATECAATGDNQNKFTVTGRGGLPFSPTEVISPDMVQDDLGTLVAPNPPTRESVSPTPTSPPKQLLEAQGWVVDDNGVVTLVAAAPNVTPHSGALVPASCQSKGDNRKSR